ncbi:MAG: glutamate--cysteine ligase [Kineosporiaceae bacterium]
MGDELTASTFTREQRQRYREKVKLDLDVLDRILATAEFDTDDSMTGLEVELNLADAAGGPMLNNADVLDEIADPDFQTELGAYNIELNVAPRAFTGDEPRRLEDALRERLNEAETRAHRAGSRIVMVGILPTLMFEHVDHDAWMSASARYTALNDSILAARGENLHIDIEGVERLSLYTGSLAPESACTSLQLHQQVPPRAFARYWNASQALAGPQLALGANSPFFYGRRLWDETRIELFAQGTDTRPPELRDQGVRPRVWFGDRWVTSIFDLFEENVRYFPALLPQLSEEDPVAVLDGGGMPRLDELRLHNGTVYRWNRPVYDVVEGRPHVRVENRVLPAGPTVADMVANAAFYYGAVTMLADAERPVWTSMSFATAAENFRACSRWGMDATVFWPGMGEVPAPELLLRRLLPLAHEGLRRRGVDTDVAEHYLGIVTERAKRHRNGATWQVSAVEHLERQGLTRGEALSAMVVAYAERMHTNQPVHEWSLP